MKHLNLSLVRLFQFSTMFFFIFIVLFYFGTLLLLPLAVALFLNTLLELIGVNGVIAIFISIPGAIWIGYSLYQISGLFQTILDTGNQFINNGISQNKRYEAILESITSSTEETKILKGPEEPPKK